MIFSQDRSELRKMYLGAWTKHQDQLPLTPLETQIAQVVDEHPEYQAEISGATLQTDYSPDGGKTNPFLHMGLHLGIREQVSTNRPAGISAVFRELAEQLGDAHQAEHRMIDCLAETLWEAQSQNRPPDEMQYLQRLRQLKG